MVLAIYEYLRLWGIAVKGSDGSGDLGGRRIIKKIRGDRSESDWE